jgi:tetratricopeptide (TPR) repeat protein
LQPDEAAALPAWIAASELFRFAGDLERAAAIKEQLLPLERATGERGYAATLADLGDVYSALGRFDEARRSAAEALTARRAIGVAHGIVHALHNAGVIEFRAGRFDLARAAFAEAASHEEVPNRDRVGVLLMLGECDRRLGAAADARKFLSEALAAGYAGDALFRSEILQAIAAVTCDAGDAAQLLAAAQRVLQGTGARLWDPGDFQRNVQRARAALGPEFDQCWTRGEQLSDADALCLAQQVLSRDAPRSQTLAEVAHPRDGHPQ